MSNNVWGEPEELVIIFSNIILLDNRINLILNMLEQYNFNKHGNVLIDYFKKLLEINDIEQVEQFLKTFNTLYRIVKEEHGNYDDKNDWDNLFFVIRALIEAGLWNWKHTSEMDAVLLNNPQLFQAK